MTILIAQRSQKNRTFAIAIVLRSFDQMTIDDREKKIAIGDRMIADHTHALAKRDDIQY